MDQGKYRQVEGTIGKRSSGCGFRPPVWLSIVPRALLLMGSSALGLVLLPIVRGGDARAAGESAAPSRQGYEKRWEEREFKEIASTCFNCHEPLARKLGRPAREHITSAHFRAAVTCHECHGGDHTKDLEEEAHDKKKGFVGKPQDEVVLQRCATCHAHEVKIFKESKHYPEHKEVRRVTCVECHGAHDIGAGTRPPEFTWQGACATCHELENISRLAPDLVAMLTQKTELYEKMRPLRLKLNNRPLPAEVMEPYRELRQLSADVVHATLAKDFGPRLAEVQSKTKALETKLDEALAK